MDIFELLVKFELGGRVAGTVVDKKRRAFLSISPLEFELQRFGQTTAAMGKDNGTHRGGFPPFVFTVVILIP